jgi:trans-2,3-dihydro-3-hydroxyanthranilate isomerase
VFTQHALEGNPLAVFPDAGEIPDNRLQKIARELNLSETVFILPSTREGCVARLRIFTPNFEMRFAGHPTVGGSWVLLDEGIVGRHTDRFQVDELVGPIPIRVERDHSPLVWLTTPPIHSAAVFEREACARALGLEIEDLLSAPPQVFSAGNPNLFIPVRDKQTVDRAWADRSSAKMLFGEPRDPICIFVFSPTAEGAYSRMFAPDHGVAEDPATGSATGPLAAYMIAHGFLSGKDGTRAISEQGTKMGRRSILHILVRGEGGKQAIEVGGYVTPVIEASLRLP